MIEFTDLRKKFILMHDKQGYSLRAIASLYEGITYGDVARVINNIEPQDPDKRLTLDLPAKQLVSVCPVHGIVHLGKCNSTRNKTSRDLFSYSKKQLTYMLENRKPYAPK